jgi:acetyl-CoA/propionyl-CoA carboxylase carboxyl transferase subunit
MSVVEITHPAGSPDGTIERDPHSRLRALYDEGQITILSDQEGSGVVTAIGQVRGRRVLAFATDATIQGGAMGREGCESIVAAYDVATSSGVPVVGIWQSGGARLAEGVASLDGVGRVFAAMTHASGRVPQISVVLFVTGPDVVRSVTGEDVDMAQLGGPEPHGRRSGVVHIVSDTDAAAIASAGDVASLLGEHVRSTTVEDRPMGHLLPENPRRAYDVHPIVDALLDEPGTELHAKWAPNVVTILGRIGGGTVGILANNPQRLGGCLDAASADKAARFVRMCNAFGVPLVVIVDVPGYLPGVAQEWDGVVRRGAKLLHAFAEANVPRITVVTRKAYGGAYIAMNSRSLGATRVFAWPTAEVAVMGAVAAVRVLHRRKLAAAAEGPDRLELEAALAVEHEQASGGVARAVELGLVDEIIDPDRTRSAVGAVLNSEIRRTGGHGNIPL